MGDRRMSLKRSLRFERSFSACKKSARSILCRNVTSSRARSSRPAAVQQELALRTLCETAKNIYRGNSQFLVITLPPRSSHSNDNTFHAHGSLFLLSFLFRPPLPCPHTYRRKLHFVGCKGNVVKIVTPATLTAVHAERNCTGPPPICWPSTLLRA